MSDWYGPFSSRSRVRLRMKERPTFLMAARPKRMSSPATEKPSSELLTSGGSTRIPISLASAMYSDTLPGTSSTEVKSAAIYSRG